MLVGPEDAETEIYYLGSGTTVDDFMKWLATLPPEPYPLLKKFAEEFQTTEGDKLADELATALADHEPTTLGVSETANEIGETVAGLDSGVLFRIAS